MKKIILLLLITANIYSNQLNTYENGKLTPNFMYSNSISVEDDVKIVTFETSTTRIKSSSIDFDLDKIGINRLIYFLKESIHMFDGDNIKYRRIIGRVRSKGNSIISIEFSHYNKSVLILDTFLQKGDGELYNDVYGLSLEKVKEMIEMLEKSSEIINKHNESINSFK